MRDERLADRIARADDQREHAFRQVHFCFGDRWITRPTISEVPRCARMRLHHDRTAGRERRGGVAAGHREREREGAGAEHGDRSQPESLCIRRSERGSGLRSGNGESSVAVSHWPVAHYLRNSLSCCRCAAALAFQTRLRQAGFLLRALDERIAQRRDARAAIRSRNSARTLSGSCRYGSNACPPVSQARLTSLAVPLPKTGSAMSVPVVGLNACSACSAPRTALRPISISPVIWPVTSLGMGHVFFLVLER